MSTPLPLRRIAPALFGLAISLMIAPAADAQSRHALAIGNDSYSDVPQLRKAVNDAVAVTDALARRASR